MIDRIRIFALAVAGATALTFGMQAPANAGNEGAAFLGGFLGGALAAGSRPVYVAPAPAPIYVQPQPYQRCWMEKRRMNDGYGGWHWRHVQVCS
jgi:hypothetical protein